MESENNVKPEDINLDANKTPTKPFELDVSMLSEEAYKLEKQKKQDELIKNAMQPSETPAESQKSQFFKFDINQIEDYLLFLNEALEDWNVAPLTNEEMDQIINAVNEFRGITFADIFNTDPQSRSGIKGYTRAYKIYKLLKNILYPRIKPFVVPFLKENVYPLVKNWIITKMGNYRNEQIEDGLSL